VDIERRTVAWRLLDRSWELAYDSLIVAAGPRGWPFSS
jgi:hypothetical protein